MRHHTIASLCLALLLVGSGAGVAASTSIAPQAAQTAETTDRSPVAQQQGEPVNQSAVNVTALEAVELVQNQTDGTVIGARLVPRTGTPAFNVTVLSENLSVSQYTVDATDPSVVATNRNITVVREQFLGGEAFDYAELRPAAEAIRLVENETNGTVTQLVLRRGQLVYGVALETPNGTQTRALVTATESPILGIQTARAPAPTANATTTTAE